MHPLDAVTVRRPCHVDWDAMAPVDDRVRFCGECRKHVFNLSAMTRAEAEALVASTGEACVRFYRRADGTVATADCHPERASSMRIRGTRVEDALLKLGVIDPEPRRFVMGAM
jgi:hypothetical protein